MTDSKPPDADMTDSKPPDDDERITSAQAARLAAFDELSSVLRHEMATVLHVLHATTEACARGDVVRGHRRLVSLGERCEQISALVDAYSVATRSGTSSLSKLLHPVSFQLGADQPGVRVVLDIAAELIDVSVPLPLSVVSLAVTKLSKALLAAASPSTTQVVRLWRHPSPDGLVLALGIGPNAPEVSWKVRWAALELERWGAELRGPMKVPSPDGEGSPIVAFLVAVRLPTDEPARGPVLPGAER